MLRNIFSNNAIYVIYIMFLLLQNYNYKNYNYILNNVIYY